MISYGFLWYQKDSNMSNLIISSAVPFFALAEPTKCCLCIQYRPSTWLLCILILGNTRNHLSTVLSAAVEKKNLHPSVANPIDFSTSNPSPMHWPFFFLEQQLHGQLLTTSRAGSILKGNATPLSSMCETHRNTAGDDEKLVLPQQLMACWILTLRWPPPTATTIVNLARKTRNEIWFVRPSMACSVWYTEYREAFLRLLSLAGLADFT